MLAVWTVLSALAQDGSPLARILLAATATAAYAIGRDYGRNRPMFVAGTIVIAILIGALASGPSAFGGGPLDPPMGYGNANGALYTLGVAAAAIVAVCANQDIARRPASVLAVALFTFVAITTSKAAAILAAGVLLAAFAVRQLGRWVTVVGALLVIATFSGTLVLGLTHETGDSSLLKLALTERRITLWHEALAITADLPIFGAGPGTFPDVSPTAIGDSDARWAHSVYLQTAAETGILGALLLGAIVLWVFGAIYRSHQDRRLVVIGTAAVTAFTVHAGIDYLAHFPVLVMIAALLAGLASSRGTSTSGVLRRS